MQLPCGRDDFELVEPVEISNAEARKLALISQQLPTSRFNRGRKGVYQAIEHLGYVQIDTISVVERAHHLTLWNRVPHYRSRYLDDLVRDRSILEYWSHAAAYLPMQDYRFTLPRMNAISSGQRHWYQKNPKLMREILARVRLEGPLQAKDFELHRGSSGGMWEWGPVKQSIEQLFMEGKLLVTQRDSFQKVFDLTERVVPGGINTSEPSTGEYAHYLIDRYLLAHGLGRLNEFGYLRRGMAAALKTALMEKIEAGDVVPLRIKRCAATFYAGRNFEDTLAKRLSRNRVKFLSPFDNLIIQRKRIRQLFAYDYQLECYLPAEKRQYGYFCLPVLWRGRLVARMDAKADRKNKVLIIHLLNLESKKVNLNEFGEQICKELERFAAFNGCDRIAPGSASPPSLERLLRHHRWC